MIDKISHVTAAGKEYPIAFTMNVIEAIQDKFGSLTAWQEKQKEFFGTEWNETDRLFTAVNGTPIHPDTVSCWFHDFIKRTGLPAVSVHGLRHTFISLMIAKGIDIDTLSNLVGHSMPSTTINMYAHAVSERKASAVEAVAQMYEGMM